MTSKHNQPNMQKGGHNRSDQTGSEHARNANPSRQAARGEPSHQKDMHDQHMLDQHEAEKREQHRKH